MWKGVPLEKNSVWRKVFNNNKEILKLSVKCPICGENELYRFFHLDQMESKIISGHKIIGSGSLWEWCGNCKHYEHMSSYVPEWWACDIKVDGNKLRHDPDYLNSLLNEKLRKKSTMD